MKSTLHSPFSDLSRFERILWIASLIGTLLSYLLSVMITGSGDLMSTIASLIGVTALIFVAKGYVLGQILTVVFACFYGYVSFYQHYYGEMITYLCMSAPMAICAVISWIKHPYCDTSEVRVGKMNRIKWILLSLSSLLVTVAFYFILRALNTASLIVSTFSVTTSFFAASLTFLRSPYYALAYALNDIVLIVLWSIAMIADLSYLPMLVSFLLFLANDLYGFFNWKRMERSQTE